MTTMYCGNCGEITKAKDVSKGDTNALKCLKCGCVRYYINKKLEEKLNDENKS